MMTLMYNNIYTKNVIPRDANYKMCQSQMFDDTSHTKKCVRSFSNYIDMNSKNLFQQIVYKRSEYASI